ncbi:MAG: hypothetical protein RLZZ511_378 [Cyanobacteriota bacterium]|jgi:hypothetical protein
MLWNLSRRSLLGVWWQRLVIMLWIVALSSGLTACGNANFPSQTIVSQAIAQQVEAIQKPLSQQLKLTPPRRQDIQIRHLQITDRDIQPINGTPTYHLSGTYDLSLKQGHQQGEQSGDRFDIYLQAQQIGKETRWNLGQQIANNWEFKPLTVIK